MLVTLRFQIRYFAEAMQAGAGRRFFACVMRSPASACVDSGSAKQAENEWFSTFGKTDTPQKLRTLTLTPAISVLFLFHVHTRYFAEAAQAGAGRRFFACVIRSPASACVDSGSAQ